MNTPDPAPRAEILPGGTLLYTTPGHPVTTDSLLLAAFCPVRAGWSACDLGCGAGVLLLSLADRGLAGAATGVDTDPEGLALLRRAAQESALPGVQAVQADVREFSTPFPFDLAVANPPYYTGGAVSPNPRRAGARHQLAGALPDFCLAAARVLKDRGRFCLCWPAPALAALFAALAAANLAPKRLQLVRKAPAAAPWLALAEARKAAGEGLEILPDLITGAGG